MIKKKKIKKLAGFSLLELLISMFIFILMIVASVSVFSGVVFARKNARDIQKNLEEGRTAIEAMAKNIRMSTRLQTYGGNNKNIRMFNNSQGVCIAYSFSGSSLRTATYNPPDVSDPDCSSVPALSNIVSGGIDGRFSVTTTDATGSPKRIGKATVNLIISSGVSVQHMQTSVSFRDYEGILYNN